MEYASKLDRQGLREACRFYGGIRAVALMAGVQNSNLGRWLKGKPTLSEEKVVAVLVALGLPDGTPDISRVHEWKVGAQWPNFQKAVRLYFPRGGTVARAPWSVLGLKSAMKSLSFAQLGVGGNYPEIYALTDGRMRAVIRRPPGCVFPSIQEFGDNFEWFGGRIETAQIDVEGNPVSWLRGPIDREVFDPAFEGKSWTWEEAVELAKSRGISAREFMMWVMSAER